MTLIGVILKLIEFLSLTSSDELRQLTVDAKEWQSTCHAESDEKLKVLYAKLHDGIAFRLFAPFLYFFALKQVKQIMTGDDSPEFLD